MLLQAIVFGWNGGLKEPWKLGSVVLEGVSSSDNDICTGFTIEVTSANDGDATFAIDLLADYLDMPSQSLLESSLAARIVGHPLFGHLLLGRGIEDDHQQEAPIPVSSQWAQQVTPPHDKGASFSSHASQCGTCCFIPGHLSPVKQRSSTCNVACSDCPRSAFMAEGSPGELPEGTKRGAATALDQAWVPGCVNCGLQWLVLEYERPMYVSSIEIHESGRPGAVVKVESTVVFRGDDTVWNTMWDRSPEEADVTAYTNGNVFAPPICSFHNWVKHVRITVSTDNSTELPPAVNAVQASGYLKTPEDYVRVNGGAVKVFYVPFQGMHVSSLANEIFSFQRVMPCNSDQEEASVESVKLPSTRPAASTVGTTWADDLHVPVRPFRRVTVVVPTSLVLNHLSSLLDGSPHGDGLAVIEVRLSQHPSNNKTKIYQVPPSPFTDCVCSDCLPARHSFFSCLRPV